MPSDTIMFFIKECCRQLTLLKKEPGTSGCGKVIPQLSSLLSEILIMHIRAFLAAQENTRISTVKNIVSSEELFPYPQILNIPPYLLKNAFSRGHRIVPVNDELNNLIVSNASEAYGLILAGAGFALLPDHLLMKHPDLKFLDWKESPHTQLGIYCRKDSLKESGSIVKKFVSNASDHYTKT